MKTLTCLFSAIFAAVLSVNSFAGPEPMHEAKDKVVMPQPDCCMWSGFYIGGHIGGQFGTSEDTFNIADIIEFSWDYSESGIVGGAQAGYNWQFGHWVFGPEFDIGYMNLDGGGHSPAGSPSFSNFLFGETSSDFYGTFRARFGYSNDCWLFYVTGGGIGVNLDSSVTYVPAPQALHGHEDEIAWGYTVGGGVERKIGCHWSIKVEYLYFNLEDQDFPFVIESNGTTAAVNGVGGPVTNGPGSTPYHVRSETDGHMVRAGLNYHF